MSLRISNKATDKQLAMLDRLGYSGTGKYAPDQLTIAEAAEIIDGLLELQRLHQDEPAPDYYTNDHY
jgi:hypothetical protein